MIINTQRLELIGFSKNLFPNTNEINVNYFLLKSTFYSLVGTHFACHYWLKRFSGAKEGRMYFCIWVTLPTKQGVICIHFIRYTIKTKSNIVNIENDWGHNHFEFCILWSIQKLLFVYYLLGTTNTDVIASTWVQD